MPAASPSLVGASLAFAVVTAYGARVAVREQSVGEPLGVRLPGRVTTHLLVGWGAATSAPWPMPVAALVMAVRGNARSGLGCAALGAGVLLGTLVEPVTWGRRPSPPAVDRCVAANLASGAALLLAGRRAVRSARRPDS